MAVAPPEPSQQLRAIAQARAKAQGEAAGAQVRGDTATAETARRAAAQREAEQGGLEGQMDAEKIRTNH
jgi:hypothetical protein